MRNWDVPVFPIAGDDLMQKGFKQGKRMGEVLSALKAMWFESNYVMTKDDMLSKADQWRRE
jgi:hypothetical protein